MVLTSLKYWTYRSEMKVVIITTRSWPPLAKLCAAPGGSHDRGFRGCRARLNLY